MKRFGRSVATVVGGLSALVLVVAAIGTALWNRETARKIARLTIQRTGGYPVPPTFSYEALAGLPPPVVRYFMYALTPGQPLIRRARVTSRGDFLARPGSWSPFVATQTFAVFPPGYLWDASVRMSPLLQVRVRDSYFQGDGSVYGRILGLIPVVDQRGSEVTVASLQRYLAEAIWFPTALLPNAGVVWTPVDERTARATITDHGRSAWIDFHFDAWGAIVGASTKRYRDVDGTPVLTPWETHCWGYQRIDGMMVPTAASVEWRPSGTTIPYWRAHLTALTYEFVQTAARESAVPSTRAEYARRLRH